jgi:hypothetical protein
MHVIYTLPEAAPVLADLKLQSRKVTEVSRGHGDFHHRGTGDTEDGTEDFYEKG